MRTVSLLYLQHWRFLGLLLVHLTLLTGTGCKEMWHFNLQLLSRCLVAVRTWLNPRDHSNLISGEVSRMTMCVVGST